MNDRQIFAHIKVAEIYGQLSYAKKLKVGCIIVKDNRIISIGYNGTPSGWNNICEYERDGKLITKPEVSHAEENAITKLACSNENGKDASIFLTHSSCMSCAKLIVGTKIKSLYYVKDYIPTPESSGGYHDGMTFLIANGVSVFKVNPEKQEIRTYYDTR